MKGIRPPTLASAIAESLKHGEMMQWLADALLVPDHTKVRIRDEGDYWDYKENINLSNPIDVAKLAKRLLSFHNAKGGAIVIGIDDAYSVTGFPKSQVADTNELRGKLRKY